MRQSVAFSLIKLIFDSLVVEVFELKSNVLTNAGGFKIIRIIEREIAMSILLAPITPAKETCGTAFLKSKSVGESIGYRNGIVSVLVLGKLLQAGDIQNELVVYLHAGAIGLGCSRLVGIGVFIVVMIRVVGCGHTLRKTGLNFVLSIIIAGVIIIDIESCTCRNSRGVYVRRIAGNVHALDRGSTGVRTVVLQADDKGVHLVGAVRSRNFGVAGS